MVYLILLILLTGACSFGHDTPLITLSSDTVQIVVKKPFLHQFADPNHLYSLSSIRQLPTNRWQVVNSVNFGIEGSPGWVMFTLQSSTQQTVWLELESHFIDSVQIWLIQKSGLPNETIQTYQPTGFRTLADDQDAPTRHPFFLKPLHLSPNIRYTVYIRGWVPPYDTLKFEVSVWHPTAFWWYQQRLIVGWAVFVGLVLMSVFITLVSYAFHHQRIYLYYCGYVLCMSGYALLNDGWNLFLPDSLRLFSNTDRMLLWHWLGFGIFFLVLFTRTFLNVNLNTGWGWLRLNIVWLALLIEAAIFVVHYGICYHRFDVTRLGYLAGFSLLGVYALLWLSYIADAIRRGFRPVWLYLSSMLVWLYFYLMDVLIVNTGWMTDPFPDMLIFRIALLTEIGLFFIGWMYRQRIIRESAQQLQIQEQARQQKLLEAERKQQIEELKALRLQNELQQQRERLARDLHDGIGSQLTHIAGRLDVLSTRKTDEQPQLQRLSDFTRETNQALRDTVWILNRSEIKLSSFAQRLNMYLFRLWEDIYSPQLEWHADTSVADPIIGNPAADDPVLSPLAAQSLFRITQEAVNNALKYAEATTIRVKLICQDAIICLIISDNGHGFDATAISNGYGLANMKKRAEEAGGQCIITSNSGGTQIHICIKRSN